MGGDSQFEWGTKKQFPSNQKKSGLIFRPQNLWKRLRNLRSWIFLSVSCQNEPITTLWFWGFERLLSIANSFKDRKIWIIPGSLASPISQGNYLKTWSCWLSLAFKNPPNNPFPRPRRTATVQTLWRLGGDAENRNDSLSELPEGLKSGSLH